MKLEKEIKVLEALANGVDPVTGEVLDDQSPYNQPEVIRSLFVILNELKNPTNKAKLPKKTTEEKQAENIENGLPKNAGLPWAVNEKEELVEKYKSEVSIVELSEIHGRTKGVITSELKKQGLIEY
ncbi:hypothetical protein [Psychromonas sp. Urea-02u-13]|uniref:hypothetical protein n=1 Tax=Psychromonas sp. Urea-02u-13 TaxID=2058326 RepID=UPI000C31D6FA|nr:hypothetical protein [Psychromonas sp. Urea-02u-13]PKG37480.1 hypothetical protein CXF74_18575 [Psychromonas sp. Urea-02u-13]